ncbi:hypothetical protein EVAR_80384_1 [Eumeta japonica]|uniref:Uncharacterized protein n=1 Tax=Eumeta variegata TaxID=151549 RepID=A0A4C1VHH6_EUMVA|nr:hypothetical protein EVAR_80384_1 [Eumeta japonica]
MDSAYYAQVGHCARNYPFPHFTPFATEEDTLLQSFYFRSRAKEPSTQAQNTFVANNCCRRHTDNAGTDGLM